MPRNHHRFGCIVNNKIDSDGRLESSNVTPLSADDFSLQLIVWQWHHRHRALGDKIAGEPFDGQGDNFLTLARRFFFGFFLNHTNPFGGVVLRFFDHLIDETPLRLFPGHSRDLLQLPSRLVDRSEEHTSELQSLAYLVCRLLLEKKK